MNKKLLYSAPEAELLVVKFEENIMSPVPGGAGEDEPIVDDDDLN